MIGSEEDRLDQKSSLFYPRFIDKQGHKDRGVFRLGTWGINTSIACLAMLIPF